MVKHLSYRSKFLKYIQNNEHSHGHNAIVAIMGYNGYNVEDAILINGGSVDRGISKTTYYNMYESKEESKTMGQSITRTYVSIYLKRTLLRLNRNMIIIT